MSDPIKPHVEQIKKLRELANAVMRTPDHLASSWSDCPAVRDWLAATCAESMLKLFDSLEAEPCAACGQTDIGQTGEHSCAACGLPWTHDEPKPAPTDHAELRGLADRMDSRLYLGDHSDTRVRTAVESYAEQLRELLAPALEDLDRLREKISALTAAVQANHEWHLHYDEYGGYPDSELCEQNCKAGARDPGGIEAKSVLPQDRYVQKDERDELRKQVESANKVTIDLLSAIKADIDWDSDKNSEAQATERRQNLHQRMTEARALLATIAQPVSHPYKSNPQGVVDGSGEVAP